LRVACDKCGRDGCYGLNRLIEHRGRNAKLIDWLDEIIADCAKKRAGNMNDPCRARFPDLPKVEETLGPEYVALIDGLQDIDPEKDKLGAEITSMSGELDRQCTR
jgi:hypothetical protein